MMNRIILNHDSVVADTQAAIIRAMLRTQRPRVRGVVANGNDSASAITVDNRID